MSTTDTTEPIEILDGSLALQAVDRAHIDIQIATARAYPRDIDRCKKDAMALATMDEATADSMFYVLPKRKNQDGTESKAIEGPSIRLAEVIANSWEHIRLEARVDSIDEKFLVATATAFDLQKNYAVRTSVRRRITGKYGKRYSDDMIVTASNAACSIALRNALFKVVPFAFVRPIYEQARKVAIGTAASFTKNRDTILSNLVKAGCKMEAILGYFGYNGADSFKMEDMITLKGVFNAIREGSVTVEDAFAGEELPTANGKPLTPAADPSGAETPEEAQSVVVESTPAQATPVTPEDAPY